MTPSLRSPLDGARHGGPDGPPPPSSGAGRDAGSGGGGDRHGDHRRAELRRRFRTGLWRLGAAGLLLGVVAVLAVRWRTPDNPLLIALAGLTPLLAVPLAIGTVLAWAGRGRLQRPLAALVVAGYLVTVSPLDAVVGCRPSSDPAELTVYTANVFFDQGRPRDIASSIVAEDPDVVVLEEVLWPLLVELREDPRLDGYAHRSDDVDGAPIGNLIWSRWPILELQVEPFVTSRLVSATVDHPQGPVVITAVHTLAPSMPRNVQPWRRQFRQLGALDTDRARVLAGDFNATTDHGPFRDLLAAGFTDAHEEKGCGFDATWPVGDLPFPIYRLDHVLVTDHFEVVDLRFGDPAGSDHLPVVAGLRFRPDS